MRGPMSQMLISMLQSLKRRIELIDPETGEIRHPLLVTREQKTVLLVVVSGDKGFAGAFNANIIKVANHFIAFEGDRQIDIEPIGRKARDFFRKRYPIGDQSRSTSIIPSNGDETTSVVLRSSRRSARARERSR